MAKRKGKRGNKQSELSSPVISDAQLVNLQSSLQEAIVDLVQQRLFGGNPAPLADRSPDTVSERTPPPQESTRNPYNVPWAWDAMSDRTQYERFTDAVGANNLDRVSRYRAILLAEFKHPEVDRALDIYGDYTVSGSSIEKGHSADQNNIFAVRPEDSQLQGLCEEVLRRTQLRENSWGISRNMTKMGDDFVELVYTERYLSRLKRLMPWNMYRHDKQDGRLDPEVAFSWRPFDSPQDEAKMRAYKPFQVVHYRMADGLDEGYGKSIMQSLLVTCNEIDLCESALTIARLTKAHRRLIYNVDLGKLEGAAAEAHVASVKAKHTQRRLVDPQTGRISNERNPLLEEENFFVGVRQGGLAGISQLPGDSSIPNIGDIEHKFDRLFAGFRASRAWFGKTGPNIRNVMDQQVLSFMKACRRIREYIERGHTEVMMYGLLSYGVSRDYLLSQKLNFLWPSMTHQDDEVYMQLQLLKLQVAQLFKTTSLLPDEMILSRLFGFKPDEVTEILRKLEVQRKKYADMGLGPNGQPKGMEQPPAALAKKPEGLERAMLDELWTNAELNQKLSEMHSGIQQMLSGGVNISSVSFQQLMQGR